MQAKDIDDNHILRFLAGPFDSWAAPGWGTWFWSDDFKPANSVLRAMPKGTPTKVAMAKMRSLIKRGLITGCTCGCRGDFEITDKGLAAINGIDMPPLLRCDVVYDRDADGKPEDPM